MFYREHSNMVKKEFKNGYLKGYEEGLNEAWKEIIRLASKGYTTRELKIMAKSHVAILHQKIDGKKAEIDGMEEMDTTASLKDIEVQERIPHLKQVSEGSFLIKEEKPTKSFKFFSELIAQGAKGLCITRMYPAEIRKRYGIQETDVLWLTKSESETFKEGECISSTNLVSLFSIVKRFLNENERSVILLEGINYLITQNSFKHVLKFTQRLNESVLLNKSNLLVPINPLAMKAREFNLLGSEFTQVI